MTGNMSLWREMWAASETVSTAGKPLLWAQGGIFEDHPIPRLVENRDNGGHGRISMVGPRANKGPGPSSGMVLGPRDLGSPRGWELMTESPICGLSGLA